ncbi:MAG: hypothetical protein HFH37_00830 [Lachnospiraceae bacterium]|jgi:hypothetical protein|nr:hypothetical protein [Lachnospiraceae bacterium]
MKKRKRHVVLLAVTGMLMAGAVVLFAERDAIEEQIKGKAAREIGKKIFEEQLEKTVNVGGQKVNVSEVVDHMDQEDVEQLTNIAEKYISPENLKQAADMAANGDVEGIAGLAKEQVSDADRAQLLALYEKYRNQLPQQ